MMAHFISPLVAAAFAVVYWAIGMYNVMYPDTQWVKNWRGSNGVFLSIFNISIFHFFRDTLCICRSHLWAAELYLQRLERKSPFLILMITPHISPETLSRVAKQKPGAKIPIPIQKLFLWDELIQNRKFSPQKLGKVSKPRSLQNRNLTLYTWCLPLFSPAKISHS